MKKNGFRIFVISTICSLCAIFGVLDISLANCIGKTSLSNNQNATSEIK